MKSLPELYERVFACSSRNVDYSAVDGCVTGRGGGRSSSVHHLGIHLAVGDHVVGRLGAPDPVVVPLVSAPGGVARQRVARAL